MTEKHVVTAFLEWDGRILILRRSDKVGTYQSKWAGISGYLEKGNTPLQQVIIEIQEETGLSGAEVSLYKEGDCLEITDEKIDTRWVVHPFRFKVKNGERIKIDWEHTDYEWIKPEDLAEYETVPNLVGTWGRLDDGISN